MYRQFNERAGISIEQGTGKVPDDGKYYVLQDGEIVGSFKSLKEAEETYRKLVEEKALPPLEAPPKLSTEQLLAKEWDLRSNKSLLAQPPSYKGKKSGRYHKTR